MAEGKKHRLGFDLGATKMLCAVMDKNYQISVRNKENSSKGDDEETAYKNIVGCITKTMDKAEKKPGDFAGIGIAVPGPIKREEGIISETPNLGFKNFPLKKKLEKEFNLRVCLENDVNAGIYGEFKKGAARSFKHVVGIFPGTGVGGGLILNGRLYRGADGGAGEIGHMIIQVDGRLCGCGQYGCLEAMASKTALAKDAVFLAAKGASPYIFEKGGTDFNKIKSGMLYKAVKAGEKEVKRIIDRSAYYLGIGMANCVNLFNPEIIVLGGGLVEKFGSPYVNKAEKSMKEHAMPYLVKKVVVHEAELGDDAVIIGAAALLDDSADE